MKSISTSKTKRVCFFAAFGATVLFFSIGVSYLIVVLSTPEDSPRARMFRTEADLRALVTAIETYNDNWGVYPPPGPMGIRAATDFLSRNVAYLPGGPPFDAWGHPYQYVPATAYGEPGSGALRGEDDYYAPGTYQLYSPGMDGDPGLAETLKQRDNITSWEATRPWRAVYAQRQKKYLLDQGRAR